MALGAEPSVIALQHRCNKALSIEGAVDILAPAKVHRLLAGHLAGWRRWYWTSPELGCAAGAPVGPSGGVYDLSDPLRNPEARPGNVFGLRVPDRALPWPITTIRFSAG
jgi:hypothetical protein